MKKISSLLFLPVLLLLVFTRLLPLLTTVYLSFTDGVTQTLEFGRPLAGFQNYARAFNNAEYFRSLLPANVFSLSFLLLALIAAFLLHKYFLLNGRFFSKGLLALFLMPLFLLRGDINAFIFPMIPTGFAPYFSNIFAFLPEFSVFVFLLHAFSSAGKEKLSASETIKKVLPLFIFWHIFEIFRYFNIHLWIAGLGSMRSWEGAALQVFEIILLITAGVFFFKYLQRTNPVLRFDSSKMNLPDEKRPVKKIIILCIGALIALLALSPFLYVLVSFFQVRSQEAHLDLSILKQLSFGRAYFNSFVIAFLSSFASTALALFGGYYLSRKTKCARFWYFLVIITSFIGIRQLKFAGLYHVMALDIMSTYRGLILPYLYTGFSLVLFKLFFEGRQMRFPEMVRTAKRLFRVIFVYLFTVNFYSYMWPLLANHSKELNDLLFPFQRVIQQFGSPEGVTEAAFLISTLPFVLFATLALVLISRDLVLLKVETNSSNS